MLRDYQQDLVNRTRESLRTGHKAPCVVSPCGSGKTWTALEMCRLASLSGRKSVWITHRKELCMQTHRAAVKMGIKTGVIAGGLEHLNDPTALLQICMIQTMQARELAPMAPLAIIDEADTMIAEGCADIARKYTTRIGFTATPARADGRGLGELFDDLILGPSIADLTALGLLSPCEIISVPAPLGPGEIGQDPYEAYKQHAVGPTVVFAPHTKAADAYHQKFLANGVTSAIVLADTPNDARRRAFAGVENGSIKVLVGVGVFGVGFDLPALTTGILARGFGHASTYIQYIGRVIRAHPSKTKARIIDLRGSCHVHGPPDAERTYHLDGEAIRSKTPLIYRFCPICGSVIDMDAEECPCGWVTKPLALPEVVGVPLVKYAAKRVEPPETRASTLARWIVEARSKGYKPAFVYAKYSAVYGGAPDGEVRRLARELLGS